MKKWMLIVGSLVPSFCFCSPPWHAYPGNNWVWSIAGGPAWSSSGMTQDLTNKAGLPVTYYNSSDHSSTLGVGELFIGVYRELNQAVQGQLGLEVAYGGNVGISGTILANGAQNSALNANYQYQIYQVRIGGKAKLILVDFPTTSMIQPYVAVGMGAGFNQSIDYKLTPANSQNIYPVFTNKSVNSFTYNAGGAFKYH